MKKILTILTAATIVAMFGVACNDKDENPTDNEVKKLPSKITNGRPQSSNPSHWIFSFNYDDQNRLTKIVSDSTSAGTLDIFYNTDNTIKKMEQILRNGRTTVITFQYNGNQVFAETVSNNPSNPSGIDTLWLNDNGQMIQLNSYWFFEYNSNGNVIKYRWAGSIPYEIEATYTDIPAVWRYANIPAWIFDQNIEWFSFMDPFTITKGYMIKETNRISPNLKSRYSYTLDKDGYPETATYNYTTNTYDHAFTIEYILAK